MKHYEIISTTLSLVFLALFIYPATGDDGTDGDPSRYDVVYNTPADGPAGSVPLGNGEVAANTWIEPNGDIVLLLARTDAWSDNGRLLKIGRVRIHVEPNLLSDNVAANGEYQQSLSLKDATLYVTWGPQGNAIHTVIWIDANRPVIEVDLQTDKPSVATASIELWRTEPHELATIECSDVMLDRSMPDNKHGPTVVAPDTLLEASPEGSVGWYHHNFKSVGPTIHAETQGVADFPRADPLLNRTFGAIITSVGSYRHDKSQLISPQSSDHHFSLYVTSEYPSSPTEWSQMTESLIARTEALPIEKRRADHMLWWNDFWNRSWINITKIDSSLSHGLVPANDYKVRIGNDQHGENPFKGQIGRLTICQRTFTADEIAELSTINRGQSVPADDSILYSATEKHPQEIEDSTGWTFSDGLTFEGWIHAGNAGRILDKTTPGQSDGMLLDTWPGGRSLRLILGNETVTAKDIIPEGENWVHVAATAEPISGRVCLYVNGKIVQGDLSQPKVDGTTISRAYALQRYINACAGRGNYPIKFNGTLFCIGTENDPDFRRWGPGYWWQNTRLPYYTMAMAGDYEMMQPLFRMYIDQLLSFWQYRTQKHVGHDGVYIPECIYFWGDCFNETYGWTPFDQRGDDKLQSSGYHKREWVSGLELIWLTLDYYDFTGDESMLKERTLPLARQVLTFFSEQYPTGPDGCLLMEPSQAAETWWDCTNPMPELAGLHAVTNRLLALPENLTAETDREFWQQLYSQLPDLPVQEKEGIRMLAPADRYASKHNCENPELYAVFPFSCFSVAQKQNGEDIGLATAAFEHRQNRLNFGWCPDGINAAYLGLSEPASEMLLRRVIDTEPGMRFPAFWARHFDWAPDQDHGSTTNRMLQSMLLQTDGDSIYLLPAWPEKWDVEFRLHAPKKTTVDCKYVDGEIRYLKIEPEFRRKDVVFPDFLEQR